MVVKVVLEVRVLVLEGLVVGLVEGMVQSQKFFAGELVERGGIGADGS